MYYACHVYNMLLLLLLLMCLYLLRVVGVYAGLIYLMTAYVYLLTYLLYTMLCVYIGASGGYSVSSAAYIQHEYVAEGMRYKEHTAVCTQHHTYPNTIYPIHICIYAYYTKSILIYTYT